MADGNRGDVFGLAGPPRVQFTAASLDSNRAFIKPKAGRSLTIRKEFPESWIWDNITDDR